MFILDSIKIYKVDFTVTSIAFLTPIRLTNLSLSDYLSSLLFSLHDFIPALSWLSVGKSYQEPVVIRSVTRGTENDEETCAVKGHENDDDILIVSMGEKDRQTLLPASRVASSSYPQLSAHDVCLPFKRDISRGINDQRDKKIAIRNDTVKSAGVEISGKRRKKVKREKKAKSQKESKSRNNSKREGNNKNIRLDQPSDYSSSAIEKARISRKNENDHDNSYERENDSGSSTDWSSDEDISTEHTKRLRKESNDGQLVISNIKSNEAEFNRNFIFLPNGQMMVTPMGTGTENTERSRVGLGPHAAITSTGVGHTIDRGGDKSIILHGVYLPDVPTYSLFVGELSYTLTQQDPSILQINEHVHRSFKSVRTGSDFRSSFSLAKQNHKLPSGTIFSDENVPVFRPLEKTLLAQKYGKSQILSEIRLKKRERYYMAGKYEIGGELCNGIEKSIEGKRKEKKSRRITDILSDVSVKRVRYDYIKKQKLELKMRHVIDMNIDTSVPRNNRNCSGVNHFYDSKDIFGTVTCTGTSGFLGSDFLPLPPCTISGIDREFAIENTDLKPAEMVEKKIDRSAFFGFGNKTENEPNFMLKNEEKGMKIEKEKEKQKEREKESRNREDIFSSDAEVSFVFKSYELLFHYSLFFYTHLYLLMY